MGVVRGFFDHDAIPILITRHARAHAGGRQRYGQKSREPKVIPHIFHVILSLAALNLLK